MGKQLTRCVGIIDFVYCFLIHSYSKFNRTVWNFAEKADTENYKIQKPVVTLMATFVLLNFFSINRKIYNTR